MTKEQTARAFWAAVGVIYIGGIVAYYAGVKPETEFQSSIIPTDEPTAIDWIQVGGIMFLT